MGLTPEELAEKIKQEFAQEYGNLTPEIIEALNSYPAAAIMAALPQLASQKATEEFQLATRFAQEAGFSGNPESPEGIHRAIGQFYQALAEQLTSLTENLPVDLAAAKDPRTARYLSQG